MRRTSNLKKFLVALNVIALVGLGGASAYLFLENKDYKAELSLSETERTEKKNQKILAEVREVIEVPDEEPLIILVNDPESLGEEGLDAIIDSLFDDLKKGDYILVFSKNRLGIQYRQSEQKVVKSTAVPFAITVEVFGSESAIDKTEKDLTDFGNQISITKKISSNVSQSFVYDVDGDQSAETQSIAEQLGIQIGTTLPADIVTSDQTEIVVVIADAEPAAQPAQE